MILIFKLYNKTVHGFNVDGKYATAICARSCKPRNFPLVYIQTWNNWK